MKNYDTINNKKTSSYARSVCGELILIDNPWQRAPGIWSWTLNSKFQEQDTWASSIPKGRHEGLHSR